MKSIVKSSFLLILFWFCLFFINRIVFYCCITPLLKTIPFSLIIPSLYKGLRLDLSTIGYLTSIPFLLYSIYNFIQKKWILYSVNAFNILFIILYNLCSYGECCLYREWKSKLSMQALVHFLTPSEVFRTTSWGLTFLFFGLSIVLSYVFIKVYKNKIAINVHSIKINSRFQYSKLFYFISILLFCSLSIRGGLQAIPIQLSDAYFCTQPISNDAAVNSLWNLSAEAFEYSKHPFINPFIAMDVTKADELVKSLYRVEKDTTTFFLTTPHPNIVFIILEGWSTACIKSFGGDNFAPFIDSLSKEGIRFTKLFPVGHVSDQGIPAVLSAYPCTSRFSIINQSTKSSKLPCINQDLKKYGYQSGFLFGGDLNYGNIRSYVYNKGFDIVKEEKDFDNLPSGKLGIHDGFMAKEYIKLIDKAKSPFIYTWFTLSTHMPYDFPDEMKPIVNHKENDYINSISYSDKALQHFFEEAKTKEWYPNTLFVIVSDHSHGTHKDYDMFNPEYHRIPLLFFGDVIAKNYRGKSIDKVYSQLDIIKTLLKQMKLDKEAQQYVWSKNMFNPYTKTFAYFCYFSGAGFINDKGSIAFSHGLKPLVFNSVENNPSLSDSLTLYSKAFQQMVYEDFLKM